MLEASKSVKVRSLEVGNKSEASKSVKLRILAAYQGQKSRSRSKLELDRV